MLRCSVLQCVVAVVLQCVVAEDAKSLGREFEAHVIRLM